jgi:hypothetical protein
MAIEIWPAAPFPQTPQRGYQETIGVNIIRSAMDAGPAKQRLRSKRPSSMSLQFLLTKTEVSELENWINNTIYGVRRFNFTHPRTKSTVECRLVPQGDGQFFTINYVAPDYYNVNLQFEVLP